jgi:hypothetical protein
MSLTNHYVGLFLLQDVHCRFDITCSMQVDCVSTMENKIIMEHSYLTSALIHYVCGL